MDTGAIRERLLQRRGEILSIIENLDRDVGHRDEALDRDAGERALEIENLDALFAIDRETRVELRQINDAIQRIDIGHYGFCGECGAPIDADRLAALPYADTCIDCARRAEQAALQQS